MKTEVVAGHGGGQHEGVLGAAVLQRARVRYGHARAEPGVLAVRLLRAAPARVVHEVRERAALGVQRLEGRAARDAEIDLIHDARLGGDGRRDARGQVQVEGGALRDCVREGGGRGQRVDEAAAGAQAVDLRGGARRLR